VLYEVARVHRDAQSGEDRAEATVGVSPPVALGLASARWAHLHLFEPLGRGSYGTVFRAWDSRLAREVAVKIIEAGGTVQSSTLVEAQRLARVRHPHVVTIYGADSIDGRVGIWMERLDGQTLHELVQSSDVLSAREAALIGADVCSALAAVHVAGLLHRDIKPQNVVRAKGGRTVLMDFGAGREIVDSTAVDLAGTPLFMAPELLAGATASVQSDLYGVGALLFFLTTGSAPVTDSTLADVRALHAAGAGRPLRDVRPDLPGAFVSIVERALSRAADKRFGSAGEMERALSAFVALPIASVPARPEVRGLARLTSWRLPAWSAVALMLLTAIAVMIVGRVGPFARRSAVSSPAPIVDAGVRPLTADQFKIVQAVEELAASFASRGEWSQAVTQYIAAERLYRVNTSPDAPLVGAALARVAWAQQHAGEADKALGNYELAIAKLQTWKAYPLMTTTLVALAALHQASGRYVDSMDTLNRALEIRRQLFTADSTGNASLELAAVATDRLRAMMPSLPLERDDDGDWLPDLIEVAVGLNPQTPDTDGDGIDDADEREPSGGLSNWQKLGLTLDPSKVVAHFGALDPEWVGFQQEDERRIAGEGARISNVWPAWRVPTSGQSMYYLPLTSAQRSGAMSRGWRLVTRLAVQRGGGFLLLDLTPEGPRFDIEPFRSDEGDFILQLNTSVVPYGGATESVRDERSRPALVELQYDLAAKGAVVTVNGIRWQGAPYYGHRQFQEGLGVSFGSHTVFGKVSAGEADFNLAMLVIR
jgi:serine/threonine-protein kinase